MNVPTCILPIISEYVGLDISLNDTETQLCIKSDDYTEKIWKQMNKVAQVENGEILCCKLYRKMVDNVCIYFDTNNFNIFKTDYKQRKFHITTKHFPKYIFINYIYE